MNSKRRFGLIKNLGVVAGALLLFASIASAQESTGKFTLPFQAQWGAATLSAGSYTFVLGRTNVGDPMVVIRAKAKGGLRVCVTTGFRSAGLQPGTCEFNNLPT